MNNKDKKIVKLLESGFSYDTIKKMNDYHMNRLYEAMSAGDAEELATNLKGAAMAAKELESSLENIDEEEFYEDINEEEVIETLFGNPKKKKTPPTSLGMFEGEIEEKSVSQQQQKIMGLALSVKRGDTPRDEVSKDVLDMVDGMTEKELEDFASTKHKGLPEKAETNEGTKCWKGYEKKGMKTMFGKRVPNCVKKESTEDKIRQIEESIVSLIKKSQGKMLTKGDILSEQPSIAPARPTVKPGVKPERGTPYKPKHSPKPKAGTEIAPARPTVKPGVKPERGTPYKPKHSPKPKAGKEGGLPEFLKFSNLNIQFRDE